MANLRTKIVDFRGFDSIVILSSRGRIPMSVGNFPEMLSQQILVGIINLSREIGRSSLLGYAMLCILCYAMLRYAMLCYAALRYATLRYAMLRYATLRYAML